jgi:3-oxoadipate enol-lactonase
MPTQEEHAAPPLRDVSGRPLETVPGVPRIAFERTGHGQTLVFLHGIGGNRSNWSDQLDHFGRNHQAVAWDARGYGASDDYEGPCDFAHFSQDLVLLLDHLRVERASFVGLSMGGRILMDFAARHPGRIDALVIAASFPSFGGALTASQREGFIRLRKAPLDEGRTLADLAPQLVQSLAGPRATPAMKARIRESIAALHPASYVKTLESTLAFDRTAHLSSIVAPTLLLYGEFDTLVTPAAGRQLLDLMPAARYQVIPGAGHLINIEAADAFNQAVGDFLQRVRAAG